MDLKTDTMLGLKHLMMHQVRDVNYLKKDEKEWRETKRRTTNNFVNYTWCKGW